MADEVLLFPSSSSPSPESSTSHDLKVHVEHARTRRRLREFLATIERVDVNQPIIALMALQWAQRFLEDAQR